VLAEELRRVLFQTGDPELDAMLEAARTKFLSPDPNVRRESLEKLWDAWERVRRSARTSSARSPVNRDALDTMQKTLAELLEKIGLERRAKPMADIRRQAGHGLTASCRRVPSPDIWPGSARFGRKGRKCPKSA
jgi:hypothetical protein